MPNNFQECWSSSPETAQRQKERTHPFQDLPLPEQVACCFQVSSSLCDCSLYWCLYSFLLMQDLNLWTCKLEGIVMCTGHMFQLLLLCSPLLLFSPSHDMTCGLYRTMLLRYPFATYSHVKYSFHFAVTWHLLRGVISHHTNSRDRLPSVLFLKWQGDRLKVGTWTWIHQC